MRAGAASLPRDEIAREAATARLRATLADGAQTTVHIANYSLERTAVRAVVLRRPEPLVDWCDRRAVGDALVGGFFLRPSGRPLGEVRTSGIKRRTAPFLAPWDDERACVHVEGRGVRIAARPELPARPRGDVLQAGPLLVRGGEPVVARRGGPGGLLGRVARSSTRTSPTAAIRARRWPSPASGCSPSCATAARRHDAGMTLGEMATYLAELGVESAINLDGGGSASLVVGRRPRQQPARARGRPDPGRPPDRHRLRLPAARLSAPARSAAWTFGRIDGRPLRRTADTDQVVPPLRERLGVTPSPEQPAAAVAEARPDAGLMARSLMFLFAAGGAAHAALDRDERPARRPRPDDGHGRLGARHRAAPARRLRPHCRAGASTACSAAASCSSNGPSGRATTARAPTRCCSSGSRSTPSTSCPSGGRSSSSR